MITNISAMAIIIIMVVVLIMYFLAKVLLSGDGLLLFLCITTL